MVRSKILGVIASSSRTGARKAGLPKIRTFATSEYSKGLTGENKNVRLEVNDDGVAIVRLDCQGEKVNTLSQKLMSEFDTTLTAIENDAAIKSVVLISAKELGFIAGADITMLAAAKTEEELRALSVAGQKQMARIANSKKKFVAAIHGPCLGGGLEVALACHYRYATSHPKTGLGVPEVMLGLLPGAGGTQRLPPLIGIQGALDMALTGKTIKADKAKKMGLVDNTCDPSALEHAAILAAKGLAAGTLKSTPKKKSLMNRLLEDTPLQSIIWKKAAEMVAKNAKGKYPAPVSILKCIKTGVEQGPEKGYAKEALEFGALGMTSQSKALQSIFFGQTACKKNKFGKPSRDPKTITVLGAGLMGAGIAQVSIASGYDVMLKDRDDKGLARGYGQVYGNIDKKVKRRALSGPDRDIMMSRMIGLTDESPSWKQHLGKTDLLVEAVFEDLGLKHKVIQSMEEIVPEHCIIATNTSALPIRDIAKASKRPERVVGMHYFSPVDKMPLLEIIGHEGTDKDVMAAAVQVGLKQGKTVIVVKDVEGFYVNRCLGPYMAETSALVKAGVAPERLDKALLDFGFPVGPISLADEVGVDVAISVQKYLTGALGPRMGGGDVAMLQKMIDGGMLGRKTGSGFFVYPKGKGKKTPNPKVAEFLKGWAGTSGKDLSNEEIQMRMASRFVNEAAYCLQDGIIATPVDGDIGAVFGIGFPPFLGGPFRWVDAYGAEKFVGQMKGFADKYGAQFAPCQLLVDHAKSGKPFHPVK